MRSLLVILSLSLFCGTALALTEIQGEITENLTLTADDDYLLRGGVFIGNDEDETILTIEPGVVIYGESATNAMLVIRRGSKIIADGTRDLPIVFTSDQEEGSQARGDWGGIIINGRSQLNVEGGEAEGEGGTGLYGGGDDPILDDDSGILRYVRVEFAGREISPDNELNGIAFQAVGSGTVVDYVQVHMNKDDGIEFFGGTVNAKHLYCTGIGDDNFDWTDGWQGKGQFWACQQYTDEANQGFECDNNAEDNDALPRSAPTIYNVTLIGSREGQGPGEIGMLLREGTGVVIQNTIVMNFGDCGIDIDHPATFANGWDAENERLNGNLVVDHSIFHLNNELFQTGETGGNAEVPPNYPFNSGEFIMELNADNRFINPRLANPFDLEGPNFQPLPNSPALSGYALPPEDGFFDMVDYVGAVGPDDNWLAGWTRPGTYSLAVENPGVELIPATFGIQSVHPNPFNASTVIGYTLPHSAAIQLAIYDQRGQLVEVVGAALQSAGYHTLVWNASLVAAGTYYARLNAAGVQSAVKVVLVK